MCDVKVARLLAWLWSNFTSDKLIVKLISGEYNAIADLLSRWERKNCLTDAGRDKNNKGYKKEGQKGTEVVQALTNDEVWRKLHD